MLVAARRGAAAATRSAVVPATSCGRGCGPPVADNPAAGLLLVPEFRSCAARARRPLRRPPAAACTHFRHPTRRAWRAAAAARRAASTAAPGSGATGDSGDTTPPAAGASPATADPAGPGDPAPAPSSSSETLSATDTGAGESSSSSPATTESSDAVARTYPSPEELWEKYGVLSEMDDRHKHLTTQEFAVLWWKLTEMARTGTTGDVWDLHTTAQHRDNWELNYQLLVRRLPAHVQEMYRETFNKPYLSFRPPKVRGLGMPPPQDYLEVWQAEQPTFYIKETLAHPFLFGERQSLYVTLKRAGLPVRAPKGGLCRLSLSHPVTNDIPDLDEAYVAKVQPGQVVKLLPEDEQPPPPLSRRHWLFFKRRVGTTPDYLSLKWAEIVERREGDEVQVKAFHGASHEENEHGELVPSENFDLIVVPERRLLLGVDKIDYLPLSTQLRSGEAADVVRLLWPAPLSDEAVKFLYSQEGYEYPWEHPQKPTHANDFDVNALLLPFEFVSKHEPDLPNTLSKLSVVVGSREYPIMVDFWDALRRFNEANRNLALLATQIMVMAGIIFGFFWTMVSYLKWVLITRVIKPYNYTSLMNHPRYKYIYNPKYTQVQGGVGPWAYEKK